MIYKHIKKWTGVLVVSLSIVPLFSSLQAGSHLGYGRTTTFERVQKVYTLQKALQTTASGLKAHVKSD